MKKALILFIGLYMGNVYSQNLYNPFYNNFLFGNEVRMNTRDLLQLNARTFGASQSFDASYLHTTQSNKWQFGGKFSRYDRENNYAEIMGRRRLFEWNNRSLFLTASISHYIPKSFEQYKIYSFSSVNLATNYSGKWLDIGAKYTEGLLYLSANGITGTWNSFNSLGGFLGFRAKIKSTTLNTRLSGTFNVDYTPMFSQQLYFKSGFNMGYAVGFESAFNANVGYRKNKFEINASFGNQNQITSPIKYETPIFYQAGIIFHL